MVFGIVTPQNSNTPEDERDLYQTPPDLFEGLSKIYGPFQIDGAANAHNHLLPLWMGPGSEHHENALIGDWDVPGVETKIFINPPWSRGSIYSFVRKATEQHAKGTALATLLLPATTEVAWFHDFVWDSRRQAFYPWLRIFFIAPRVSYIRPSGEIAKNPGMGSMVVSFRSWDDNWNLGNIETKSEFLKVYGDVLERTGIPDGQRR
jgi:phage N-6-adenine-methyltransferase